ncbi:MAG TPA: DUF29 family protein [Bryobacteraceae bacterium]
MGSFSRISGSEVGKPPSPPTATNLEHIFEQSPSLLQNGREQLSELYSEAVSVAIIETGLPRECFPAQCPYTFGQIMDFDFLPE